MNERHTDTPSYPSILNDVIGPVMRGPSSSHCAAALRIGRLARDLMGGSLEQVLVEVDAHGALATTHASQGSDMGLCGGLLGWEAWDERLPGAVAALRAAGIAFEVRIAELGAAHPNTYVLTLSNAAEHHQVVAISTGGGMIDVIEIDGAPLSMQGDYYETLFYLDAGAEDLAADLASWVEADAILVHQAKGVRLLECKSQHPLPPDLLARAQAAYDLHAVRHLDPVLPVLSRRGMQVPYLTCEEMLAYDAGRGLPLWELAVHYEAARGNLTPDQVVERMRELVEIMRDSIQRGVTGTAYADRILGCQSRAFQERLTAGQLLDAGILNRMILYVTAIMECKSAMGTIVAAPTAGACGALPGACIGAAEAMGLPVEAMAKGLLTAGLIGVLIAARATFAAEVGGCQAECGAGSGMAAAALVTLAGGDQGQALAAASMALQNVLGMVCDPVANRVEVPCLGKNVMAASNALACANMALAGFDPVIPLDEVIEAMDRVGRALPRELRCTALGGLSIAPTSRAIEARLERAKERDEWNC
ncbi:MAG: L-serine ammonia-lyase, iron-sulfur-dependent, subunit alpha [Anaerolineae bacterium]